MEKTTNFNEKPIHQKDQGSPDHQIGKHTIKVFNNPEADFKVKLTHNINLGNAEVFGVSIDPTEK